MHNIKGLILLRVKTTSYLLINGFTFLEKHLTRQKKVNIMTI